MTNKAAIHEPPPQPSDYPDVADLVVNDLGDFNRFPPPPGIKKLIAKDIMDRKEAGVAKYGMPLRPHNGRDAAMDLYQELLDAASYARQRIYELEPVMQSESPDTKKIQALMLTEKVYSRILEAICEIRFLMDENG